jgi:signal transduction histidine kinase
MQRIIETLLTAARAGVHTTPGRCSPAEVVAELLGAPGPRPDLRITADVHPDLIVGLDAAVLQRLLAPLLDNAVRCARSSVTVRAERDSDGVVLVVGDDGPGVAPEDVDRVFQPGWRADPDDEHDGGGLGLALAARLATASAGWVSCRPGPGGRFEVHLPPG